MAFGLITSWEIEGGKVEALTDFIFLDSQITVDGDWGHKIKRCLLLGRKAMTNLDRVLKSKDPHSQSHSFSSSHVWMWEVDHKEGWGVKNWCFPTVVLEKTNQSIKRKSILNINWKDYCWSSNVLTTWCKELTRWKRPWYWERLKAKGEDSSRGWDD